MALYHTNSALYPVIALLERGAGFEPEGTAEQRLDRLTALLARSTDQLADAVPLVAALLSIPTGECYPPVNLNPQRQKQRTLEILVDQLAGLAAQRPVLAIYEDLHWVARAARSCRRARAAPSGLGADHVPTRVQATLGRPRTSHPTTAEPPRSASGGCDCRAAHGRQGPTGQGVRPDCRQNRRGASVPRGADQDGARVRPAARYRRTLRTHRADLLTGDPSDPSRLAYGTARSSGTGQGRGADPKRT